MSSINTQIQQISSIKFDKLFQLIEQIDHGSFGTVIKVFDRTTNQFVAIKRLIDNSSLATMIGEMKIMKKINHQNILGCLGLYYVKEKGKYLLVMPYCENGSLRNNIKHVDLKGPNFKIKVCYQLAQAINALHKENIMHRDISPGNILFDEKWQVKVCDFGFGKSDIDSEQSTNVGTQAFRDPNVRGGKYSKKCDIYSAGLVMDYIFRGCSIFKNDKNKTFENQYVHFLNNKKDIVNGLTCPSELKEIILNCMESEQSRRLNSKQLVQCLKNLMNKFPYKDPQSIEEHYYQSTHSIESQTQSQKQRKEDRTRNKFQKKSPTLLKMKTHGDIEQGQEQNKQPFMPSVSAIFFNNNETNDSMTLLSIQKSLMKIPNKKKKSLHDNNNIVGADTEMKQFCEFVTMSKKCSETMKKIKNFSNVYKFYLKRKQEIRKLDKICRLEGIEERIKKIIIFISFFAYLRFLKLNRSFLSGAKIQQIESIDGVHFQDMTPKTIDLCLQLLDKQTKVIRTAIKVFTNEIYLNKNFCKGILTKHTMEMLGQVRQKNLIDIQKFSREIVHRQFSNIVSPELFITKNSKQQEVRLEIKKLISYLLE